MTGGAGFMQGSSSWAVWLLLSAIALGSVALVAAPSKPDHPTPPAGADDLPPKEAATPDKAPSLAEEDTRPVPLIVTEEPPPEFRGPDVTLIASEERMVYEYRQNGQLRMIKVVPKLGKPYYLVPYDRTRGFGDLEQAKTLVAEWVLWEF